METSPWIFRQALWLVLTCLILCYCGGNDSKAFAANHAISPGESRFSCRANGVRPGDTIVISGRSRGPLAITDCFGTANSPITITNDTSQSGPLVIAKSNGGGGGFIFHLQNLQHVVVDGTGGWRGSRGSCSGLTDWPSISTPGACGIKVTMTGGRSTSSYVHIGGSSKFLTVKGLQVDGGYPQVSRSGTGVQINEHSTEKDAGYPYSNIKDPVNWRDDITLADNYIHNIPSTCIYDGPNYSPSQESEWKLRNHEIRHNRINNCGNDAIKVKVCWGYGDKICEVHHNYITNIGIRPVSLADGATDHCIMIWEGNGKVYNNHCVDNLGTRNKRAMILAMAQNVPNSLVSPVLPNGFQVELFNNVVRQAAGAGIAVDRRNRTRANINAEIYNNTIVDTRGAGISIDPDITARGVVRDNIVAGESINAGSYSAFSNSTESVARQRFRNAQAGDYRLTANSPARDRSSANTPNVDHDDVNRSSGANDLGAFEFTNGGRVSRRPNPPVRLTAQ